MVDQLNIVIVVLVVVIENNSDVINDVFGSIGLFYNVLNDVYVKFGDYSGNVLFNVMIGLVYYKLIGQNLINILQLFQVQNVIVVDILGKVVVVIDVFVLYEVGILNKQKVLGLVEFVVIVYDVGDVISNIEMFNGQICIEIIMQVDYIFGLGLKGYSWDEVNGGKFLIDVELVIGINWDQVVIFVKYIVGVIVVGDVVQ